jgi:nanoRNase/pAp phosphatase (c-di-AMP/oligoRNAs hydrolase)
MSLYGGGGQAGAGACVIPSANVDEKVGEIVAALQRHA